jgi:hypothetical protein
MEATFFGLDLANLASVETFWSQGFVQVKGSLYSSIITIIGFRDWRDNRVSEVLSPYSSVISIESG